MKAKTIAISLAFVVVFIAAWAITGDAKAALTYVLVFDLGFMFTALTDSLGRSNEYQDYN